jgi:uncharacterized membrane protein
VKIWAIVVILFHTVSYIIIIICGRKMVKFVAENDFTGKLKELNRQLTRNLIILVCIIN